MPQGIKVLPNKTGMSRAARGAATRTRIIAAAQAAFSGRGFSQSSLREIAASAGVTSPLIVKHFGSKATLFRLALERALDDATDLTRRRATYAAELVAFILDPDAAVIAPSMIALSLGDEEARAVIVTVIRERIIRPVGAWLGGPDGAVRAADILVLSIGLTILGRYLRLEDMDTPEAPAARWLAATLQRLIDASDLPADGGS